MFSYIWILNLKFGFTGDCHSKQHQATFLAKSINITLNFKNLKYKFIGILGTELHVLNFKLNFQPQNCIEESEVVKFGRFSFPISWVGLDGVNFLAPQYNLLCAHGYKTNFSLAFILICKSINVTRYKIEAYCSIFVLLCGMSEQVSEHRNSQHVHPLIHPSSDNSVKWSYNPV